MTYRMVIAAVALVAVVVGSVPGQAANHVRPRVSEMAFALSAKQVASVVVPFREWMINANTPGFILPKSSWSLSADRNYSLKGLTPRKFLQSESQSFGINIGWTDNASAATEERSRRFFFTRQGNSDAPIVYGEKLAIGLGKSPSFIRYKSREFGINLDWSSKPVYEWVILGGTAGTPVRTGQDKVVIFNLTHQEPLMYFDRTVGGDIGWPDSQTWAEAGKEWVKENGLEYAKKAAIAALISMM